VGQHPPAKFVFEEEGRRGQAFDSMVSPGVIVSGGTVRRSVLSPGVVVESGAVVEDSVILDDTVIGPGAMVRRAILDKGVIVSPGAQVGIDRDLDLDHHTVSAGGVVVVGKGGRVRHR
jgi:glucose-1-phosphate adenylyltransferase